MSYKEQNYILGHAHPDPRKEAIHCELINKQPVGTK